MKIVSRWDKNKVLFEDESDELIRCLEHAVRENANLFGADLSEANLTEANLSGAYLSGANLSRADLSRAYLSEANLTGADLFRADLSGANLTEANLYRADLYRANLTGADLSEANLFGCEIPTVSQLDTRVLQMIEKEQIIFNMQTWHEVSPCGTTCCRAGAAVVAAGEKGLELEKVLGGMGIGTHLAALLIYRQSCPTLPDPDFFTDKESALADMRSRAGKGC